MSKPKRSGQDLIDEQQNINLHHMHGCCNKRYHCDGSKCPVGWVLNPALGIPLGICTGGLSAAAFGMYRGVRDHRRRTELKKAYEELNAKEGNDSEGSSSSSPASTEDVKTEPSPMMSPGVPVEKMNDGTDEDHVPSSVVSSAVEKDATPATSTSTMAVEKMDDSLRAELESHDARGAPPEYVELAA